MAETSKLMIQSGLLSVASGVLTPLMKWPEKKWVTGVKKNLLIVAV